MRAMSLAGRLALAVVLGAVVVATHAACCSVPSYTPSFWNDGGVIQGNNNCYNYSNNRRTDTFAQPGRAAGAMWTSLTCPNVHAAATADGLEPVAAATACPSKKCRLALVVDPDAPGRDYHWYRQDANGMWTHKPGGTQATNLDNSSNPITNPETADRGGYIHFCGYFCACSSSTEGNGHENIN